ncbi:MULTISPECIES: class I SAM-dependent methyltransferase [unclassified Marinovum]
MAPSRLTQALAEAELPADGRIAVFAPTPDTDLSALPRDRVQIISRDAAMHAALAQFECTTKADGPLAAAIVITPRAKAEARALIADAVKACPDGMILVDGQKTDGVDSLFKACRSRVDIIGQMAKAHGRAFWFASAPAFADWHADANEVEGFRTLPGVFSADGIDPASALLAAEFPVKPGKLVADLGAGWGYLAARALENAAIEELHLVESDAGALDCARHNVTDPRARFHWADVTRWQPKLAFDTVISNPPFHQGRKAVPELGQAFIATARRILRPGGTFVMVANRHLPYEATLAAGFGKVEEIAGDTRFKILKATRPTRSKP